MDIEEPAPAPLPTGTDASEKPKASPQLQTVEEEGGEATNEEDSDSGESASEEFQELDSVTGLEKIQKSTSSTPPPGIVVPRPPDDCDGRDDQEDFICGDRTCHTRHHVNGNPWPAVLLNGKAQLMQGLGSKFDEANRSAAFPQEWYHEAGYLANPAHTLNFDALLQLPLTSMVLVAANLPRELAFLLVMLAQCVQVLEFKDNQLATVETKKGLSRRLLTAALPLLGRLDRVSAVQFLSVIEHT